MIERLVDLDLSPQHVHRLLVCLEAFPARNAGQAARTGERQRTPNKNALVDDLDGDCLTVLYSDGLLDGSERSLADGFSQLVELVQPASGLFQLGDVPPCRRRYPNVG